MAYPAGEDHAGGRTLAQMGDGIERMGRKIGGDAGQPIIYLVVAAQGARREDDPFGVVVKALRLCRGHGHRSLDARVGVADAGGGTDDDRGGVALGELKRVGHELEAFLGRGRVEHRNLGEAAKAAGVLLGLG